MWKTVCRKCGWTSGEAYLKSVAEAIGKVHEEDNAGHRVMMEKVSTLGRKLAEKEDSEPHGPGRSKS
jgi:hypothetical protein